MEPALKICVLQTNPLIGAVKQNLERLKELMREHAEETDLFVTPELAIIGYSPRDLLSLPSLIKAEHLALEELRKESERLGVGLLIGHTEEHGQATRSLLNVATLYDSGMSLGRIRKRRIPYYDIFEETRFFGEWLDDDQHPLRFRGVKLGVNICEDAWWEIRRYGIEDAGFTPHQELLDKQVEGADIIVNLSASPYSIAKPMRRIEIFSRHSKVHQAPLIFATCAGAQDEILFDGHSFALNKDGKPLGFSESFEEGVLKVHYFHGGFARCPGANTMLPNHDWDHILLGLTKGIKDYVHKTGFQKVLLGLSGGIDSALVAYLAARALGPENVTGISLPTQFNSAGTRKDAQMIAESLGIHFFERPIQDLLKQAQDVAQIEKSGLPYENLQSRIRGMLLMTQSATEGSLLLTTGNKSEIAMGYATLYGDMCGALCPIGDLYKTEVFSLCHHIQHTDNFPFPEDLLLREPSAELAENQVDSNSLPPYPILDVLLEDWIENQSLHEERLREFLGRNSDLDYDTLKKKFILSEFKRNQAAPILKLHSRSFGGGWLMPIAKKIQTEI